MTREKHPGRLVPECGRQTGFENTNPAGRGFRAEQERGRWSLALALLFGLAAGVLHGEEAIEPASNSSAGCLKCHGNKITSTWRAGRKVSLFVDKEALAKSAHGIFDCIDCHEGFDGRNFPHKIPITPVNCAACHENTGRSHSFHPRLAAAPLPASDDTSCAACHGTHAIAAIKSAGYPFLGAQQAESCGRCHQAERDRFLASAHGRALTTGAAGAPDCLDCRRQPVAKSALNRHPAERERLKTTAPESPARNPEPETQNPAKESP